MTANCAYLVVIVISVTRPDVLLSCEAAVGKHFSYIHTTLIEHWSTYSMHAFVTIALFGLHPSFLALLDDIGCNVCTRVK